MQRWLGILLISLLAINLVGPLLSFRIARNAVRRAGRRDMELAGKLELEKLKLTEADYAKAKVPGKNEVVINGSYYDVKEMHRQNGEIVLLAKLDKKETHLVKQFVNLQVNNKPEATEKSKAYQWGVGFLGLHLFEQLRITAMPQIDLNYVYISLNPFPPYTTLISPPPEPTA